MIGGLRGDIIASLNELRNLKTAHLHGLGNTLFYRYYFTISDLTPDRFAKVKIVCTMADDALFPPYITLDWLFRGEFNSTGILFKTTVLDSAARTITYDLIVASETTELELAITSSSRIATIVRGE